MTMKKYSSEHLVGAMLTSDVPHDEYMYLKINKMNFQTAFKDFESNLSERMQEWIAEINDLIQQKNQASPDIQVGNVNSSQQVSTETDVKGPGS